MLRAPALVPLSPHVVVVGNEKGGSGKTTIAMHLAVALLKMGQRVGTIDLDSHQRTLSRYIENRRAWARRTALDLEQPIHFTIARAETRSIDQNEATELHEFDQAVTAVQESVDFLVIDTPPHDSYLTRLAHAITDTLVTPLNDSFLDLDALALVDPVTYGVTGVGHYAEMAREARRQRRWFDGTIEDWFVVRNRISLLESCVKPIVSHSLEDLGMRLGFQVRAGFAERLLYRRLFPAGLTAVDDPRTIMPHAEPDSSYWEARHEVERLLEDLKLPVSERGRRRRAARAQWFASRDTPLEVDDILAPSITPGPAEAVSSDAATHQGGEPSDAER